MSEMVSSTMVEAEEEEEEEDDDEDDDEWEEVEEVDGEELEEEVECKYATRAWRQREPPPSAAKMCAAVTDFWKSWEVPGSWR